VADALQRNVERRDTPILGEPGARVRAGVKEPGMLSAWLIGWIALMSADQQPTQLSAEQPPTQVNAVQPPVVTLDKALESARTMQPQMKYAQSQTDVMHARIAQARAGIFPTIGAVASYSRTTANFVYSPGSLPPSVLNNPNLLGSAETTTEKTGYSNNTYNYWRFALSANQLIYDFGQTPKHWSASEATYDAQAESQHVTLLQILLTARTAFFSARAQKDLAHVAHDTLQNQGKHLDQIKDFVEVGTRDQIDLAQAKTDYANAQVTFITAQNNYDNAKATLNQAMGVETTTDYDVSDELMPPVDNEDDGIDALMKIALDQRPEFGQYRAQIRAQQFTLDSLRADYWPNLNATATLSDAGVDITEPGVNWSVGAYLSWPLFLGGLTHGQVQEASATLSGLSAQMDQERQAIRLEVEQARLSVRAAKATLKATAEALENAKDQLRLAEGRYSTGVGSVIELGDAQVAQASAAAQNVQAEYSLASARATLTKALGRM
jgi:outer membrane protein